MNPLRRLRLNQKGYTMIEIMITTAIIGIVTPAITFLFLRMSQGMAGDEMRTQLQNLNTNTMLRVRDRLLANRRLLLDDGSGISYISKIAMSSTAPPVMVNSRPASIDPSGSFSGVTATARDFGDSLFLAVDDSPTTIAGKAYNAPITASDPSITWSTPVVPPPTPNPAPVPAPSVIDVYRFYYYYLTTLNAKAIPNATTYRLVEWRSVQYADYYELSNIPDPVVQQSTVAWLATANHVDPSNPTYTLTNAWDPTQDDPNQAFYTLSAAGAITGPTGTPTIPESDWSYMTHVTSGILSNGFSYGIAPNNPTWYGVPSVPAYGAVSVAFPAGFEVGVTGNAEGRQVLIRSLLVAKGASPMIIHNDMTTINAVRDIH